MAKALFGHIGGPDPRMVNQLRMMQRRIDELEAELMRVRAENDALAAELHRDELLTVSLHEPALT
jgi:hypothetical protein